MDLIGGGDAIQSDKDPTRIHNTLRLPFVVLCSSLFFLCFYMDQLTPSSPYK